MRRAAVKRLLSGSAAIVITCLISAPAMSDETPSPAGSAEGAAKTISTSCQNCHGLNGDSTSPTFPRLNGQQADYISAQLKAFRGHTRGDPHAQAYMWGMAAMLDDGLIGEIAKYYSKQSPAQPQSGGSLAAEGKTIFMDGVEKDHVPPCQACHGDRGQGDGTTPRIAGQHRDYLVKQLEAFRSLLRTNEVMHANTKDMTDSEIEAVVSYLAND
ncbi:MAG: c-type cytochrome [Rhizomicrobium sp.]|jgi:cytochrome c553